MPAKLRIRNEAIHEARKGGESYPSIAIRFDISDTRARTIYMAHERQLRTRPHVEGKPWRDLLISQASVSNHLSNALQIALGHVTMGQLADKVASGEFSWSDANKLPKFGPATWRNLLALLEAHGVTPPAETKKK